MNNIRSDVAAADERIRQAKTEDSRLKSGVKSVIAGASALGASSKILPFLSSYLTPDMALKGINKVAPEIGKFLQNGMKSGLSLTSGLDYLRQNSEPKEEKQENAEESRNIIEQYSPELNQFIQEQIGKGLDPLQAGAIAQNDKRFSSVIQKLMKDHKTPWSNIIESIFGKEVARQKGLKKFNEKIKKKSLLEEETERFNQGYGDKSINLSGMGQGMVDNLYEGLFNALKQGKDTFSGVKDPILQKAKPYFDKGFIKSALDLKNFVNGNQGSQQPEQNQQPNQGNGKWDAIAQSLQGLLNS